MMKEKEGRRSKTDIILDVLNQIRTKEKTIGEIAKYLNTNWESVKDAIGFLLRIGHIKETMLGSDKKYIAIKYGTEQSKIPTYFKLPVVETVERFAGYIYYKITEIFREKHKTSPTSTQLQKIAVEIFESDIAKKIAIVPTGWYRFGKISVFGVRQGDLFDEYRNPKFDSDSELQKTIEDVVGSFSDLTSSEIRKEQYKKESKIQYLILLELEKLQSDFIDLNTNKDKILKNLDMLVNLIPDKAETRGIIRSFLEFKNLLLQLSQKRNLNDFKAVIYDTFSMLWDALATYNFYESLLTNNYYQKEILDDCFLMDIWLKQFTAQTSLEELKQKAEVS